MRTEHHRDEAGWRLLCSHGGALVYIARHPGCTAEDVSAALVVTPRTVWRLIGDLKREGLIRVRKEGKRHRYSINEQGHLPDPALSGLTLSQLRTVLTA